MRTFPIQEEGSQAILQFEIENVYVSPYSVGRILSRVPGVSEIRVRKLFSRFDEVHVWFRYLGHDCEVSEPFGDNSRFLISTAGRDSVIGRVDLSDVEAAFRQYTPPLVVRLIGDLLSLRVPGG